MIYDRMEYIEAMLYKKKKVFVSELSEHCKVSEVTIRKDLKLLESEGIAKRFHGGAMLLDNAESKKALLHDEAHLKLARLACEEICDGDSIFLGSGRTCLALAELLTGFNNLTVITNNISALDLLLRGGHKVFLIGGEVSSTDDVTLFASLPNPMKYLDNIFAAKAFTSVSGIDLNAGITVNSVITTYIYENIKNITNNWYVFLSSEKFDKIAMYTVEKDLSKVDCFITDVKNEKYYKYFEDNNIAHKCYKE